MTRAVTRIDRGVSRADQVERRLRDAILRGEQRPGERLPSERELCETLGVGRSSVREAVGRLSQLGLVDVRPGGGAVVRPIEDAGLDVVRHLLVLDGAPNRAMVEQLLDVHEVLMVAAVGFAVGNATEAEIRDARRHLTRLTDPSIGDAEYFESVEELVQLISVASRNLVLRLIRNGLRTLWQRPGGTPRMRLRPAREEIARIAHGIDAALAQRDALHAQDGVRELLRANREQLLKRIDEGAARDAGARESDRTPQRPRTKA